MKKKLLLLMYLIGLSVITKLSAQNLDINNLSACTFSVSYGETDPTGCKAGNSGIVTSFSGSSITSLSLSGLPYIINKFTITDACQSDILYDYTICGLGNKLNFTFPSSSCCPVSINVTLSPGSSTTNAIITIN